jgi:hypothetical protein
MPDTAVQGEGNNTEHRVRPITDELSIQWTSPPSTGLDGPNLNTVRVEPVSTCRASSNHPRCPEA